MSHSRDLSRRSALRLLGTAAGAVAAVPALSLAQGPVAPATVISNPPRDFGPNGTLTTYFSDPDILTIDPRFDSLIQPNAAIKRLWTGALWM